MRYILYNSLFLMLFSSNGKLYSQVPQKSSYQAVIRDVDNNLIVDSPVALRISILQEWFNGEAVYIETHQVNTNSNGLVTLEVGRGTVMYGQFDTINWGAGPYFLKSELDPSGGFDYSVYGTNEILSVPYALHAATADSITGILQMVDSIMTRYPAIRISNTDIDKLRSISDTLNGTETVFDNWDKNVADDFSGNYNDLINVPKNLSDFNNDTKYITTESDPDFNNSVAVSITSDDINRWDKNATEMDPVFASWDKSSGISISQSQIKDFGVYEKSLTAGETSIDVGFSLLSTSSIYLNGTMLSSDQWSGVGTTTILLNLDIEIFDKLKIER